MKKEFMLLTVVLLMVFMACSSVTAADPTTKRKNISFNVPEVSTIKQSNKIFRENEKKGLPFLAIKKGRKYGKIEYDFITTPYQLREEARQQVQRIFEEMADVSVLYKMKRTCLTDKVLAYSPKCELDVCRDYAALVKNIIFNKRNWEFSKRWGTTKRPYMKATTKTLFKLELENALKN